MSELKVIDLGNIRESIEKGESVYYEYYPKSEADKVIAEKDKEIAKLKEKLMPCLNGDCILTCEVVEKYGKENAELKAKLGAVNELVKESRELLKESQRMHQRCADNASKQIRRLKRALYKACAEWALSTLSWLDCIDQGNPVKWGEMRWKCLKKAEEYK